MLKKQEVVVSGVSGRFPGCFGVGEFRKKLFSQLNLLERDERRWNAGSVHGKPFMTGKMPNWDRFDSIVFGVHPKLVQNSDPMMGKILETSFEAIVDAGISPYALKGHNICVISCVSTSDAEILRVTEGVFLEGSGMVGHSKSMMANRISYCFNFTGPSYNCDSSWTSTIQAMKTASDLVAAGSVEAAIVTTCNLITFNTIDEEYIATNLFAQDGKCSPFDVEAHGFVRSEGAASIFIQRAENAKRIYCSLLKAEAQYLGSRERGFLRVDPMLQTYLMKFYNDCEVKPGDISYVEAHGLGVEEIDTVELNTLANVFCNHKDSPLPIGSLGGNLGNSEATKGLVSLIKVIIAMESGTIPPTINYHTPNPKIPALASGKLKPLTEPTPLSSDFVAVNCLSLFGSMGHLVLRRNCKTKGSPSSKGIHNDGLPRLVILQARHEEGAREVIQKINSMTKDVEFFSMVNGVFKTPIPSYLWRAYTVVPSSETKLTEHVQQLNSAKRPLWYIFSGMGSQWAGMGKDLMKIPVFASAVDKCDQVLRPKGLDIKHIITSDSPKIFDNIINCFVGIAAIQIGLVDILNAIGITPDGIIGHSVGELGCAYADGCLTAQEMVLSAYARGKASIETDVIYGMMAAVGLGYNTMKHRVPPTIDVACHNASDSCSLSGPAEDVFSFVEQLQKEGVFAKAVSAGNIAFHSRYIKHVAPKLLKYLKETIPNPKSRTSRWISSSVPQSQWDNVDAKMCSAEYHTNNLLNPVLFEEACQHLPKNVILIEIAPRGLMQAILRRSVSADSINIPLTSRSAKSNMEHLLNSLGQLHLNEIEMDINALYPPVEYPVARGTPSLADLIYWDHSIVWFQEYSRRIEMILNNGYLETSLSIDEKDPDYQLFKHHCINGEVVIPVSQLLIYPCKSIMMSKRQTIEQTTVIIEDVVISDNLYFESYGKDLAVTFVPVSLKFEVIASEEGHFKIKNILTGKIQESNSPTFSTSISMEDMSDMEEVTEMEIYSLLSRFGYQQGTPFQIIRQLLISETECIAKVQWTGNCVVLLEAFFKIIIFLQAEEQQTYLRPSSFKKLTIDFKLLHSLSHGTELIVHYNRLCNRLVCEGLELIGLTLTPFIPNRTISLKWRELKLQPYTDTKLSLQEFMMVSIQLTSDANLSAWREDSCHIETLVIKDDKNKSYNFSPLLSETLKNQNRIYSKVVEVDVKTAKTYLSVLGNQSYLVAGEYNALASLQASTTVPQNTYFLAKLNQNGTFKQSPILKPILIYQSDLISLALLKIGRRNSTTKVYEIQDSDWLNGLRKLIKEDDSNHIIVVASHILTPRQVLPVLSKENYAGKLRTFFIMDHNAPHFSLSCPLYSSQLSVDLPVNILSNGMWNSLRNVDQEINPQNKILNCFIKSYNSVADISCVGLNTTKFTLNQHISEEESEMKFVDYSGYQEEERVMGVAQLDLETKSITTDPILKWPVPAGWTMEDAATVPVVYTLVYYCILLKAKVEAKENILVNAGMSPIGQAVINIALKIGANIFASVMSAKEAADLIIMYPTLNPKHVFVMDSQDVAVGVRKMTKGKGVEVVINCLRGKELQASILAMGFDCRFLHLGHIKVEDGESIGMMVFLKNTSFHGISFDNVANCNRDWKLRLKEAVELGLQQGLVKPFKRTTFSMKQENEAFINLRENKVKEKTIIISVKQNGMRHSFGTSFQSNHNHFTLIAGTKMELWIEVAEWLVRHGARRLVILTNEEMEDCNYLRKLNKLMVRHHTDIVVTSSDRLDTLDNAKDLFQEILHLGTVSTIVCINMDEKSNHIKNLDLASRQMLPQLQQFLSLLGKSTEVCESRAVAGLPVCSIQSDSSLQTPAHILQYLQSILDNYTQARFLIVSDKVSTVYKKELQDYQNFLSLPLEKLSSLGNNIVERPKFKEDITRSPGYQHVRHNLLPVFVIPGIDSQILEPLFRHLINPAYTCSLPPSVKSVSHFAKHLLHDLLGVQRHGKFNLVGESWSGATALLLGSLLEAQGHQVELFLVEGAPYVAQKRLRILCERHGADLPTSLLASLLNLHPEVTKSIVKKDSWEEKLHIALEQVPKAIHESVSRSLTALYSHMMALLQFPAHSQLFKGKVTLITQKPVQPSDLSNLSQVCLQAPRVVVTGDGSHQELIANVVTASVINENVLFDWNL